MKIDIKYMYVCLLFPSSTYLVQNIEANRMQLGHHPPPIESARTWTFVYMPISVSKRWEPLSNSFLCPSWSDIVLMIIDFDCFPPVLVYET